MTQEDSLEGVEYEAWFNEECKPYIDYRMVIALLHLDRYVKEEPAGDPDAFEFHTMHQTIAASAELASRVLLHNELPFWMRAAAVRTLIQLKAILSYVNVDLTASAKLLEESRRIDTSDAFSAVLLMRDMVASEFTWVATRNEIVRTIEYWGLALNIEANIPLGRRTACKAIIERMHIALKQRQGDTSARAV